MITLRVCYCLRSVVHIVTITRDYTPRSLYYCLFAPHIWVLFFAHIPFVVNHTFNATPTESLQQHQRLRFASSYWKQQLQALAGLHNTFVSVFSGGVLIGINFLILSFDLSDSKAYVVFLFVSMSTFAQNWRCVTQENSFLIATDCDWFAWCGSPLWLTWIIARRWEQNQAGDSSNSLL